MAGDEWGDAMFRISVKRIYEAASPDDGFRVLIDRIWPRGMTKEHAAVDLWLKEIAPTTPLRQWFHHQEMSAEVWQIFCQRYRDELQNNPEPVSALVQHCESGIVTLLYSAKDREHNQALVLKDYLTELETQKPR